MRRSIGEILTTIEERDWYNRLQDSPDPKKVLENEKSVSQTKIIANIR